MSVNMDDYIPITSLRKGDVIDLGCNRRFIVDHNNGIKVKLIDESTNRLAGYYSFSVKKSEVTRRSKNVLLKDNYDKMFI